MREDEAIRIETALDFEPDVPDGELSAGEGYCNECGNPCAYRYITDGVCDDCREG